jgi:hypothetical protein
MGCRILRPKCVDVPVSVSRSAVKENKMNGKLFYYALLSETVAVLRI